MDIKLKTKLVSCLGLKECDVMSYHFSGDYGPLKRVVSIWRIRRHRGR